VPSDLYTYTDGARPAWTVRVGGKLVSPTLESGYAVITREWRDGDIVELNLPMPVRTVRGHPRIEAVRSSVAFERGPVVFAFEDAANKTNPADEVAAPDGARSVTAIPYGVWSNRGLAPMAVWLKEKAQSISQEGAE
jgi:DUF1680 family protein